jgi:hypothetical protein
VVAVQWKWRHFQTLFLIAKMASMLASLSWLYPPSGGLVHDSIKVKMSQFLTGRISHALGDTLVARGKEENRALPAAPSQVCSIVFDGDGQISLPGHTSSLSYVHSLWELVYHFLRYPTVG